MTLARFFMSKSFEDEVTKHLSKIYEGGLEAAKKRQPPITRKQLAEYKDAYKQFLQLRQTMISDWEEQREEFSTPILRRIKKALGADFQEAQIYFQAFIDAHLVLEYGRMRKKRPTSPPMQIANTIFIAIANDLLIRSQEAMQSKVGHKAGQLMDLLLREIAYYAPKDIASAIKQTEPFFQRHGLIRTSSKRTKTPIDKRPYFLHFKLVNRRKFEAKKKGIKRTDLEIYREVTEELEGTNDKKAVYRVQSGVLRINEDLKRERERTKKLRVKHLQEKPKA